MEVCGGGRQESVGVVECVGLWMRWWTTNEVGCRAAKGCLNGEYGIGVDDLVEWWKDKQ